MTALDDRSVKPSVTTGPISGSRKVYREVGDGVRVPFRRVGLTNGEHVDLYDTSGPYTDDSATIDVHSGLPKLRADWVAAREPVGGAVTQLAYAKAGVVTPEMRFAAIREGVDAELLGEAEVAQGRRRAEHRTAAWRRRDRPAGASPADRAGHRRTRHHPAADTAAVTWGHSSGDAWVGGRMLGPRSADA